MVEELKYVLSEIECNCYYACNCNGQKLTGIALKLDT